MDKHYFPISIFETTMNVVHKFIIGLCLSGISFPQSINISQIEKENFAGTFKNQEVNYPGDPSFDVIYYKLNLTVLTLLITYR